MPELSKNARLLLSVLARKLDEQNERDAEHGRLSAPSSFEGNMLESIQEAGLDFADGRRALRELVQAGKLRISLAPVPGLTKILEELRREELGEGSTG